MKKILIGGILILGISHCQVTAKELKQSVANCKGEAIYIDGKKVGFAPHAHTTNKVDRKNNCSMSVMVNAGKLVIKQTKNPCFFIDKEMWEMWKGKKVNYNTVSFTAPKGKENVLTDFNDGTRPDLGHNIIFKNDGTMTNSDDGYPTIQVLGKSKQCYLRQTVEEWTLYSKEYKKGRDIKGKVKFYLSSNKLEHKSLKKSHVPKKSHVSSKTTSEQKKETRIRIYKYGGADGFGGTFNSASDCEKERIKLTKSHVGSDYSYKCEKK